MTWQTPSWWYKKPGLTSGLLAPAAAIWGLASRWRRFSSDGYEGQAHLLLVGNATAGGSGKTPTAMALASLMDDYDPCFLSKGHGGRLEGPHWVHSEGDHQLVGDEALLLAAQSPTLIAKDRVAGAMEAAKKHDLVILDDGLQNHPSLRQGTVVMVVDAGDGFGNGKLIPAGPLREPAHKALAKAHGVVLVGAGKAPLEVQASNLPIFRAKRTYVAAGLPLRHVSVFAFCGIARPKRFFAALEDMGAKLVARHAFADHQPIPAKMVKRMADDARKARALLITTEKDMVRLDKNLRSLAYPLIMRLEFDDPKLVKNWLADRVQKG